MITPSRQAILTGLLVMLGAAIAVAAPPTESEPFVPEQWRQRVRDFVHPGPSGLPGGLKLAELKLGGRVDAVYRGDAGELAVSLTHPAVAPPEAVTIGQRLSMAVVSTTLEGEAKAAALERLTSLLKGRAEAWGWLRRTRPDPEAKAERDTLLAGLVAADRRSVLGEGGNWEGLIDLALGRDSLDLSLLMQVARMACRHGAGEALGRKATLTAGLTKAAKAAKARREGSAGRDRLELRLASAEALAGRPEEALKTALEVVKRGTTSCRAARVAADLACVRAVVAARELTQAILAESPRCGAAWEVRLDVAADREAVWREALDRGRASADVQALSALRMLTRGDPKTALAQALVAATLDPTNGQAVHAAFAAATRVPDGVPEALESAGKVPKASPYNAVANAVRCYGADDIPCAADAVAELASRVPGHTTQMDGLLAVLNARAGRVDAAKRNLADAWRRQPQAVVTLLAEAEVSAAGGDRVTEKKALAALKGRLAAEPTMLSQTDLELRLNPAAAATGSDQAAQKPAAGAEGGESEPDGGLPVVVWVGLGLAVVILGGFAVRQSRQSKSTTG